MIWKFLDLSYMRYWILNSFLPLKIQLNYKKWFWKEGNEFTFAPMAQPTLVNLKILAVFCYCNTNLPCNYDYVRMVYKATNYLNTTTWANHYDQPIRSIHFVSLGLLWRPLYILCKILSPNPFSMVLDGCVGQVLHLWILK